jgi:5'-3' exonuclease
VTISVVVDGSNILIRAARAMQHQGLSSGEVETGSILAFIRMLNKTVRDLNPDRVAVFWDTRADNFRHALYPSYKGTRLKGADDANLYELAQEFLVHANVPQYWEEGYEADDLIAAYCMKVGDRKYIVSDDKDLHQLITDSTTVVGSKAALDLEGFKEKYGYWPKQHPRVKAFMGDPSDNIPGLRGIGPKKALKALSENGWSMRDALYALGREDELSDLLLSYQLVDLCGQAPGNMERLLAAMMPPASYFDFKPVLHEEKGWDGLRSFLEDLEMTSILHEYISHRMWRVETSLGASQLPFDPVG